MSDQRVELVVSGLVQDPSPVALLQDKGRSRCIPVSIGTSEAFALGAALVDRHYERPLTHDLLSNVIRSLDGSVREVIIRRTKNSFQATVLLDSRFGESTLDSRASDAIILAVKAGAPIFAPEQLFIDMGVVVEMDPMDKPLSTQDWSELLELADPEDFKYEM